MDRQIKIRREREKRNTTIPETDWSPDKKVDLLPSLFSFSLFWGNLQTDKETEMVIPSFSRKDAHGGYNRPTGWIRQKW